METAGKASLRQQPTVLTTREILTGMSEIATPPLAYLALSRLLEDPSATANDFAAAIERDPGVSVRLLKLVNSPYYGAGGEVEDISRAITRVGLRDLESLVLSASAIESFSGIAAGVVDMNRFWSHSVYCAVAARKIANLANDPQGARVYVAGLLHDVGALAIYCRYPEFGERNVLEAGGDEARMVLSEFEWFGTDHARIGAELLRSWHIPEATCRAIQYHHDPGRAPEEAYEPYVVQLADRLANQSSRGRFSGHELNSDDAGDLADHFARCGVGADIDLHALVDSLEDEFRESIDAFLS